MSDARGTASLDRVHLVGRATGSLSVVVQNQTLHRKVALCGLSWGTAGSNNGPKFPSCSDVVMPAFDGYSHFPIVSALSGTAYARLPSAHTMHLGPCAV